MAWFTEPRRRYKRDASPKRYPPPGRTWRGPRRSRAISWAFCILVLLLIVFWPQHHRSTMRLKRTTKPVVKEPDSRPFADQHSTDRFAQEKRGRAPDASTEHVYRADGLLEVNPRGRHPIFELIERSETQWKHKVAEQSRTFKQAVAEYRRRYQRLPPKGFEIWWDYVDFHGVKLVDEYDSIHARLEPFWGVDPRSLRAVQSEWETRGGTFTIGKVDGEHVALLNDTMNSGRLGHKRAQEQIDILEEVQEWLPDFRATFTMHDGPAQFTSWELRQRAEEAAAVREYLDVDHAAASIRGTGWASACPPHSPIHIYSPSLRPPTATTVRTFIHDHRLSMDPCLHPSHLTLNGYLSQYRNGPNPHRQLVPTFSICASALHSDILTVAPEQFEDEISADPAWDEKPDERLLWRGSNTGILHQDGVQWNISHRIRLVEMGTRRGGTTRVLIPRGAAAGVGTGEELKTSLLNTGFMDIAFVRKPIQCRGPVCDQLQNMFEWRATQSWQDAWQYKYIMDVDGNGWSARFKRLMTSRSLVFKSTIFPEWYTERIMPWVHYVPIQVDLSDLYDTLAFFRGDLSGADAHDDLAQKIATAGKEWSETFYRREDITAYHFRLFLEYARVMSDDRDAMSYRDDTSHYDDDVDDVF